MNANNGCCFTFVSHRDHDCFTSPYIVQTKKWLYVAKKNEIKCIYMCLHHPMPKWLRSEMVDFCSCDLFWVLLVWHRFHAVRCSHSKFFSVAFIFHIFITISLVFLFILSFCLFVFWLFFFSFSFFYWNITSLLCQPPTTATTMLI